MKPLDGIVVLDLTRLFPGAAATLTLANFGAVVIKIEEPGRGDYARWMPPLLNGLGATFTLVNRGKKSVAINLKDAQGRETFLRLAARADILAESFRPGVMQRLGLDYDTLRAHNARLIYLALTGYGQSGRYAGMAGHDINYLSLAGVLDIIGPKNGPSVIPGVQIADLAGGALQAVIGVLLALAAREKTGRGQMVDVSMLEGLAPMLPVPLGHYAATGRSPLRGNDTLTGRYGCYNVYRARDDRWISVGALEPKFWEVLCRGLGCEQFIPDQFAEGDRQAQIIAALAERFQNRDAREWFELFRHSDACVTPVQNIAEAAETLSLGITPRLSDTPGEAGSDPPQLGEHTREVLLDAGMPETEVDALERDGILQFQA